MQRRCATFHDTDAEEIRIHTLYYNDRTANLQFKKILEKW